MSWDELCYYANEPTSKPLAVEQVASVRKGMRAGNARGFVESAKKKTKRGIRLTRPFIVLNKSELRSYANVKRLKRCARKSISHQGAERK